MIRFFIPILALFLLSISLQAKHFNYWQVHQMPKSIEKDYYIWRLLLQKSTTYQEAINIIGDATKLNKKLHTAYKNKTGRTAKFHPIKNTRKSTGPSTWKIRSHANKSFKQGLTLMQKRQPQEASKFFEAARLYYVKRYDIDKSLFWLYLSTKEVKYLHLLHKSHSINIYTLMASDSLKSPYHSTITEKLSSDTPADFDIKNPIDWAKVKHKMKAGYDLDDLADEFKTQESIGIYTYLKAKASKFQNSYFPMPYRDAMEDMPKERQALIYAIARQESRFVPASVSRSFALGMMQFMPFLIKHIAKQKGEHIDLDAIFDPYKAIEYADIHLDYLTKYLHHPLFIAYAYNGGIGFTRRHIKNPHHFRMGAYEPYMSMEMMKNVEAREYGKKVLANYVIYLNKLGVETRIFPLLRTLANPEKTDKFRK